MALTRRLRARRSPPPFVLGGECRRCGQCCESPSIQVGAAVWYLTSLRETFLWWQRRVNGFTLVDRDPVHHVFVSECTHFDPATRLCDCYASRPGMCRDYPRALFDQPSPEMWPGCGYLPLARNAEGLRAALRAAPIHEEQRARLLTGLHLEAPPPPP